MGFPAFPYLGPSMAGLGPLPSCLLSIILMLVFYIAHLAGVNANLSGGVCLSLQDWKTKAG